MQAQQLWLLGLVAHGVWDLPGPGIEPLSPPLAGRFLTTGPPEKSLSYSFNGKDLILPLRLLPHP